MKTGLSILVVACCLSVSVMGQMKIENGEGNMEKTRSVMLR